MIILASMSPRRRQLLNRAGVAVRVVAAEVAESIRPGEDAPGLVGRLADAKACAVATVGSPPLTATVPTGALVLGADTVVTRSGRILGKPQDAAEAAAMLRLLAGGVHQVLTGWALWRAGQEPRAVARGVATTEVEVRELTTDEIDAYLSTDEWSDKAGGYAIQGYFSAFIPSVRGSYASVVGLPVCEVVDALRHAGAFTGTPWPQPEAVGKEP